MEIRPTTRGETIVRLSLKELRISAEALRRSGYATEAEKIEALDVLPDNEPITLALGPLNFDQLHLSIAALKNSMNNGELYGVGGYTKERIAQPLADMHSAFNTLREGEALDIHTAQKQKKEAEALDQEHKRITALFQQ